MNQEEIIKNNYKTNYDSIKIYNQGRAEKHIVVIGESLSRNYMGIYGYERNNTPYINQHYLQGDIIKFNNVITLNTHTDPVLRKVFTVYGKNNNLGESPDIVSILKKAGYKIAFFSNQAAYGVWDSFINIIMAKANFIFYSAYKYKNNSYDEVLLPEISNYLAQNKEEKLIIFVHLMGSHGNAADRYPKEFNFYQNESQKHRLVLQQQVNEYDNSVLHNDSIMNSLYHIADSYHIKSVLYFSDHGDEVGSDVAFLGHSYTIGSKAMLEIPFLIYTKDNKVKAKLKDTTNKL